MNDVPNAMQAVANDEHGWYSETDKAEQCERNHRSGFDSPRFLLPEIRGERQIECRDCDQEQSEKYLLCFCREQFLRNEMEPAAARNPTQTYSTIITASVMLKQAEELNS